MSNSQRPIVLAVDDEAMHNLILQYVLKEFGATPILTTTSEEFLSQLVKTQPALCLIDINLHFLGEGYRLIKTIRSSYKDKIPIIVISQKSDYLAIAHSLELGANDFITKPLDKDLLAWKLKRYLKTEELLASDINFFPVPEGGSPAEIEVEITIKEVDEFGLKLRSRHLPLKGSVIHLEGQAISGITGQAGPQPFIVNSTWLADDGESYELFAEFDMNNEALMDSVRKWLFIYSAQGKSKNRIK